ncbi:MAG TPA: hypothetical protein VLF67_00060 [Candidatus Saccharimonas sp.]|nr:hypothetical protein [Candidatus Saccharimonas sp.]
MGKNYTTSTPTRRTALPLSYYEEVVAELRTSQVKALAQQFEQSPNADDEHKAGFAGNVTAQRAALASFMHIQTTRLQLRFNEYCESRRSAAEHAARSTQRPTRSARAPRRGYNGYGQEFAPLTGDAAKASEAALARQAGFVKVARTSPGRRPAAQPAKPQKGNKRDREQVAA